MRKIISFMHISLDGFVAGLNGEMDWIKVDEEIFDYVGKRINEGDTALYGRVTYQMMENYWPTAADSPTASKHDIEHSKWYNKVHKVVLSKTMKDADLTNTTIFLKLHALRESVRENWCARNNCIVEKTATSQSINNSNSYHLPFSAMCSK